LPFNLAGIQLYVDFSFLVVLPLMVWATTQNFGLISGQAVTGGTALGLGVVAVVGLFTSIVLHELGHSLVARWYGVRVRRITLWFLGGVAELEEMPRQRGAEAVVGIAGPIVSFVLAALLGAVAALVGPDARSAHLVCGYLALVNLMLGTFNLLPALPMDGGRILRSLLAMRMGQARATVVAGTVARVIAVGMVVLGLRYNPWLILLAIFIWTSVGSEARHAVVTDLLRGLGVGDLMNRDVRSIPASVTVGDLSRYVVTQHHTSFPVVDERGRLIGTIGVEQLRTARPDMLVWQAMSTDVRTIAETAGALEAVNAMGRNETDRLIVVDDAGEMTGILTQADLARAIQVRMMGFQVAPAGEPTTVTVQRAPSPYAPYSAPGANGGPSTPATPVGYTRSPWSSES
jgi:Zn-dependent protease